MPPRNIGDNTSGLDIDRWIAAHDAARTEKTGLIIWLPRRFSTSPRVERLAQNSKRMIVRSQHPGDVRRRSCAKQTLWLALMSTPAAIISRKNNVLIASFEAFDVVFEGKDCPRVRHPTSPSNIGQTGRCDARDAPALMKISRPSPTGGQGPPSRSILSIVAIAAASESASPPKVPE